MRIDVSSAFEGYTSALVDLYKMIGDSGWSVKKVKFDKKLDRFVAEASNEHGETISKHGPNEEMAVRHLLLAVNRKNHMRSAAMQMLSMWKYHWIDQMRPIAEAYAKAPVYDPKAAAAYKALADDSQRRAEMLRQQLQVEETNDPQPYTDAKALADDIHKRRKLKVSRGYHDHPVWTPEQHTDFRLVHQALGHGVAGGDFGWEGTNHAVRAHMPLLSAEAQKALFSETIGQMAYANLYRHLGPPKIALFPEFIEPAQAAEGVPDAYQGVHPSQTYAPAAMPAIKLQSKTVDPTLRDPNEGWNSNIETPEPNAYMHHGDPLEAEKVMDTARIIDTEWSMLPDKQRQKEAVENAFRAVLLSPQKDLRWNTIHYQDLLNNHSSDPVDLWNTLEKKRQDWNVKNFGESARLSHRPYHKLLPQFESIIYQMDPEAGIHSARQRAGRIFFEWETQEQNRISEEEADVPEDKRMNQYEVENATNKALAARLKMYVKEFQPKLDYEAAAQEPDMLFPELEPQPEMRKLDRYGAFIGTHLKAIAQVSLHADEILKAALEDVHEHDGAGHHFRAAVLQLGLKGIGPKTCSFAWLLLQPMTSQLATIDQHMMRILDKDYESEMNNRDYFKFERELKAGRDAAGYSHLPLGAFQWGMWDFARTGPGSHQDHSGLRVLDPTDHEAIDWQAKEAPLRGESWTAPDWWMATKPWRDQVGEEWDKQMAPSEPKNKVPYLKASHKERPLYVPWFTHPYTGEQIEGQPGQTLMQHLRQTMALSTPEIWALVDDAGKRPMETQPTTP